MGFSWMTGVSFILMGLGGLDRGGSPERSRHNEIKPGLQLSAPLPILWRGWLENEIVTNHAFVMKLS